MPIIKVISSGSPAEASLQGQDLAAAVMAVTLAKVSQAVQGHERQKRSRAEKTRPRNPNKLTINQHVFPSKSIGRFTDQSGHVSVHDLHRNVVISAKPDNAIFCARRAWDERAEMYMKRVEDEFQQIVGPIVEASAETVTQEQKPAIDRMYALWYVRSRYRELESQEIKLNQIAAPDLTKAQEENLEKSGYLFARPGRMPARQLNGLEIQMRAGNYAAELAAAVARWGVISALSGEFIVPDVPSHGIIPLTSRLALVQSGPDGTILEGNVAEINRAMKATSRRYFFAQDFSSCPS